MEAPTVNNVQAKKIDISSNNHNYSVNLSYLSNLKISINCIDERKIYENEFSLEQMTNINRYFLMCESIKDIFDELSSLINDKADISFSDNNLKLKILLPRQKNREAVFILYFKKKSLEEEINYFNELLNKHETIIKEQNIKIENQESEIKILKEKISDLEKRISSIETIKNRDVDNYDNEDEVVVKLKKIIGRKCNLQLLYQMKRDGNKCETFHEKVDNKGPTITLFKTQDGYQFGGYTSKSFGQGDKWIKDPDSFLFNFINLNKYPIKSKNSYAIFLGDKRVYGPEFFDILINQSDIQNGEIRIENYINKLDDLKGGDKSFINNDVIVYKVEFI